MNSGQNPEPVLPRLLQELQSNLAAAAPRPSPQPPGRGQGLIAAAIAMAAAKQGRNPHFQNHRSVVEGFQGCREAIKAAASQNPSIAPPHIRAVQPRSKTSMQSMATGI